MSKDYEKFRRLREDAIRDRIKSGCRPNWIERLPHDVERVIEQDSGSAFESIEMLETRYLEERNPVDVWRAIAQVSYASQMLGQPIDLPPWVRAYLFTAAEHIMGCAVDWKEAPQFVTGKDDRKVRKACVPDPVIDVNEKTGSQITHSWSDNFGGLTGPQRIEEANKALGFAAAKGGSNPFVNERRRLDAIEEVQKIDNHKRMGLTDEKAIDKLKGETFKVDDKPRKLRRLRNCAGRRKVT